MEETDKIWMNGELVDWADATVHVGVHGLHYGTGVFEGIRCYETPKGPAVFRLADHMQRLHDSARLLYMDIPFTVEELREATHDLVRVNGLAASYIRPIAFYGYGQLGVSTQGNPVETVIMSWPWGAYLARMRSRTGSRRDLLLEARRAEHDPARRPRRAVSTSTRCWRPPRRGGADTTRRSCSPTTATSRTGPGENIFVVKNGVIRTPPLSTSILPGLTRDAVITIAQDLGYVVEEAPLIRADLYLADEFFMTGTAAEVTPVRAVDDQELGVGPVTREIQGHYLDTVNGRNDRWSHWLDVVDTTVATAT